MYAEGLRSRHAAQRLRSCPRFSLVLLCIRLCILPNSASSRRLSNLHCYLIQIGSNFVGRTCLAADSTYVLRDHFVPYAPRKHSASRWFASGVRTGIGTASSPVASWLINSQLPFLNLNV